MTDHDDPKECGCGAGHVPGRACTPEAKRELMARLLAAWQRRPQLRLGQLLVVSGLPQDPFGIEDEELASLVDADH